MNFHLILKRDKKMLIVKQKTVNDFRGSDYFQTFFLNYLNYLFQIAVPDLVESVTDADILVFVVPHQFVKRICSTIKGKLKTKTIALSLIKVSYYSCILLT